MLLKNSLISGNSIGNRILWTQIRQKWGFFHKPRTSLNRGEAYHQLRNKIASVGGGDFRGMSDLEVEIWNECNRFIALIIIYYNMHLLSKLYEIALEKNNITAIEFLKKTSPIAFQHINISGLYEFSENLSEINLDNIIEELSKILDEAINSKKA